MSRIRDLNFSGKDLAYVAVIEGPRDGRETVGWYLGLAVRDEAGYHRLSTPRFGPYENQEAASEHAKELNTKLGHTELSALEVVLSSMRGPGAVRRA